MAAGFRMVPIFFLHRFFNLLVEVLNRMQLSEEVKSFGNSNGDIPGLV